MGCNYETERKFLVKNLPFSPAFYPYEIIDQFYISQLPEIRARRTSIGNDTIYVLGIKRSSGSSSMSDITRREYPMSITPEEFNGMLQEIKGNIINKRRFHVPLGVRSELMAEVDIYNSNLSGLQIVEVEFHDEEQANAFVPPLWFGEEVSTDKRYKNYNLAQLRCTKDLI